MEHLSIINNNQSSYIHCFSLHPDDLNICIHSALYTSIYSIFILLYWLREKLKQLPQLLTNYLPFNPQIPLISLLLGLSFRHRPEWRKILKDNNLLFVFLLNGYIDYSSPMRVFCFTIFQQIRKKVLQMHIKTTFFSYHTKAVFFFTNPIN